MSSRSITVMRAMNFTRRSEPAARCNRYAQHRVNPSPLTQVGQADITAHVDWTSVAERAEACGLTRRRIYRSTSFHDRSGDRADGREQFEGSADSKTRRALQTLLHPEFLGTTFQFLALTRNVTPEFQLGGFKFARDPRVALGLPR